MFTWRVQNIEDPEMTKLVKNKKPFVLAFWHGDEIAVLPLIQIYSTCTMASTSKDGELMSRVLNLLGMKTSRGSSTRKGVQALKGLIKILRSGRNAAVAVDGPKGPYHKIKPGVFEISKIAKGPVFAAGVVADRKWVFHKAWNKTYVPKPFAKVIIQWSRPLPTLQKSDDAKDPYFQTELEKRFDEALQEASRRLAADSH